MRNFGVLSSKWYVFIIPQVSGIYTEEEEERLLESKIVDDSKETVASRYNRTDMDMKSQTLEQHTQDRHKFEPDEISAQRRESKHKTLPLTRTYLQLIPAEKGNSVLQWSDIGYINHNPGPVLCPGITGQHKMDSMLLLFMCILF